MNVNYSWLYMNRFNDKILIVTRNICGCCPNDYLLERGNRFYDKWTVTMTASELGCYLDSRGFEFVDCVNMEQGE